MPLSLTEPIEPVPESIVIATMAPPVVRLVPAASFAWTVSTWVLVPLAVMLALVGVSVDWAALAEAGTVKVRTTAPAPPAPPLKADEPFPVAPLPPPPGAVPADPLLPLPFVPFAPAPPPLTPPEPPVA